MHLSTELLYTEKPNNGQVNTPSITFSIQQPVGSIGTLGVL